MKFCYLKTSLIRKLVTTIACQCFEMVVIIVCPCLSSNRTLSEVQSLLYQFFFPKLELPNWGCTLSAGAAYKSFMV